jgi:hypothetical protein
MARRVGNGGAAQARFPLEGWMKCSRSERTQQLGKPNGPGGAKAPAARTHCGANEPRAVSWSGRPRAARSKRTQRNKRTRRTNELGGTHELGGTNEPDGTHELGDTKEPSGTNEFGGTNMYGATPSTGGAIHPNPVARAQTNPAGSKPKRSRLENPNEPSGRDSSSGWGSPRCRRQGQAPVGSGAQSCAARRAGSRAEFGGRGI